MDPATERVRAAAALGGAAQALWRRFDGVLRGRSLRQLDVELIRVVRAAAAAAKAPPPTPLTLALPPADAIAAFAPLGDSPAQRAALDGELAALVAATERLNAAGTT